MPDEKDQSTAWDMDRELAAAWSWRAVVTFQAYRREPDELFCAVKHLSSDGGEGPWWWGKE
jgi:hypothetical protein